MIKILYLLLLFMICLKKLPPYPKQHQIPYMLRATWAADWLRIQKDIFWVSQSYKRKFSVAQKILVTGITEFNLKRSVIFLKQ